MIFITVLKMLRIRPASHTEYQKVANFGPLLLGRKIRFLAAAAAAAVAIVQATLCAIECGTPFLGAFNVPCIAVFAAVANMTFVAYGGRSDPIMSIIPDTPYSYLLIAKHLLYYTIIMML